jgi:putative ABC transport system permease protein
VRFIVAMAWREVRSSWRRLVMFFLCIALGVGAMVSLRSFTRVFTETIAADSRLLLGADVRVDSSAPWTPAHLEILARHAADPGMLARTRMIETQTIVRADGGTTEHPVMVELRAVEASFPLRGAVRLAGGRPFSTALLAGGGALVSPSLLERLHVGDGGRIVIGTQTFTIRGILERVPGNALDFSPIPRVLVDYGAPEAAGLTGFGSRARYYWMYSVEDGGEGRLSDAIAADLRERRLPAGIGTFHFVERWLAGSLSNIDGFLSLIGLSMIVLGGIGVASVTRVFVQQRVRTIAILKCLGGRTRKVIGAYVAQVLALGLGGSLLGLLVAQGITRGLAGAATRRLPLDVDPRLSALACVQGVAVGVLIALLFALPPLLDIRDVKPILVLRQDAIRRRRVDLPKIAAQVLIAAAIAGLAGWMAGTYRDAGLFVGGIAATAVVLHAAGTATMAALSRLGRLPSFALRQGVNSLHRPGNQTRVTLFAVGLGALFVIAVRLFQVNLQQEYTIDLGGLTSDMFVIDVTPGDKAAVAARLSSLGAAEVTLAPVAQARLVGIHRAPSNHDRVPRDRFGGEFRVTERAALDPSEQVDAGVFWTPGARLRSEVSVERDIARWLALAVGDTLVFEVAGRQLETPVTSIRSIDRRVRSLTNLVRADFLLQPGTLDALPHTFVGGARGPSDPAARATLQNAFLSAFPAVTLVDALDDISEIRRRIADFSSAVSIVGGFVLACGMLILTGSVAMTKLHRLYEGAILKTLGAKRRVLVRIALVEYGVLGLLAGIIGSAASIAVTWGMSRWGARPLPWHLHPLTNAAGVALTAALVMLVGVVSTWDVVAHKPIGILKEQ